MTRQRVLVATADPELRCYIESCLGNAPGLVVVREVGGAVPDLLVCDEFGVAGSGAGAAAVLLVLDEPPSPADRWLDARSNTRLGFILTPFDARSLVQAALRLL